MDTYNLKAMWGALVFRGMLAILFGVAAVFWPGITIVTLVYLFAGYVVASGLVNQVVGLTNISGAGRSFWGRILLVLLGVLEVGVGVYLFRHPLISFSTLIILIGVVLIVRALFDLYAGIFDEGGAMYRTVMVIGGILAGIAGVLMLVQPVEGGVAFVWVLGLYALLTGPMLLALGFEAKSLANNLEPTKRTRR